VAGFSLSVVSFSFLTPAEGLCHQRRDGAELAPAQPQRAVRLVAKPHEKVPPADTMKLYTQMYRERYGPLGLAAAVGRNVLGLKT
jgi:hypothetical protein